MHTETIEHWRHDHIFGQDITRAGEKRAIIVTVITVLTAVVEIVAGAAYGSMALLADGLHMVSHAMALTISALAYYYTRKKASDARFSFGTGKVNSLAAFASAVLLFVFALLMAWESVKRFINPVSIGFNQAVFVAVIGLAVNAACMFILRGKHEDHGKHGHHDDHHDNEHEHGKEDHGHSHGGGEDHNLLSAYLHVMADALTSVLAIFALLAGKYFGYTWLDPFMGVTGAFLVARWSIGLIRVSCRVLMDFQGPEDIRRKIEKAIEAESGDRISDLHVWSVGPGIYAAEIAIVTSVPLAPDHYVGLLPAKELGLVHVMVEIHPCIEGGAGKKCGGVD